MGIKRRYDYEDKAWIGDDLDDTSHLTAIPDFLKRLPGDRPLKEVAGIIEIARQEINAIPARVSKDQVRWKYGSANGGKDDAMRVAIDEAKAFVTQFKDRAIESPYVVRLGQDIPTGDVAFASAGWKEHEKIKASGTFFCLPYHANMVKALIWRDFTRGQTMPVQIVANVTSGKELLTKIQQKQEELSL